MDLEKMFENVLREDGIENVDHDKLYKYVYNELEKLIGVLIKRYSKYVDGYRDDVGKAIKGLITDAFEEALSDSGFDPDWPGPSPDTILCGLDSYKEDFLENND